MSQYNKPTGALFINNKKDPGSNQPDHNGNIEIDKETIKAAVEQINGGAQFAKLDLAGWNKEGPNAGSFISLKASKPYKKPEGADAPNVQAPTPKPAPSIDDKIPF